MPGNINTSMGQIGNCSAKHLQVDVLLRPPSQQRTFLKGNSEHKASVQCDQLLYVSMLENKAKIK